MKKETLFDLLDAESHKAYSLENMQLDIENGDFVCAMHSHLEYLYWTDVWMQLYADHEKEYWDLRRATGEFNALQWRA